MIRKRIAAYGMAALCVCMLLLTTARFYVAEVEQQLNKESLSYLAEVARQNADAITNKIEGDLRMLRAMAVIAGNRPDVGLKYWAGVFADESQFGEFQRISIILPDGRAYGENVQNVDFSDREYFRQAIAGRTYISDAMIDRASHTMSNVYAVPIRFEDHQVAGVLAAVIMTDTYQDLLYTNIFDRRGYNYIVKSTGEPVVRSKHPNSDPSFENLFDLIEVDTAQKAGMKSNMQYRTMGSLEYTARGEKFILSYVPLKINDWYAVSVVPYAVIAEKSYSIMRMTVAACGIVVVICFLLIAYSFISGIYARNRLERVAYYDELTGAPNKNGLRVESGKLLANGSGSYAYVVLDIRRFKMINDIFGFAQGDSLLCHIVGVLRERLKQNEIFARVTADQFHLLLDYHHKDAIRTRLKGIADQIRMFRFEEDPSFGSSACCGVYVLEGNKKETLDQIGDKASLAREQIKDALDEWVYFYDESIRLQMTTVLEIESDMQRGIDQEEFIAYFQPKYSPDGALRGAEALVRWNHRTHGLVSPNDFIPVFERNGFIVTLDLYMMDVVCRSIRKWLDAGLNVVPVSVNQSRHLLYKKNYFERLVAILDKYGIPHELVEIEVTESVFFENAAMIIALVRRLHDENLRISMDDFGSGYSSLNMLKELAVDTLKIDKDFFSEIADSERSRKIIGHVISMAADLRIQVVAEGVETLEQVRFLSGSGCDLVQGFYFSKPLAEADFEALLRGETHEI